MDLWTELVNDRCFLGGFSYFEKSVATGLGKFLDNYFSGIIQQI